MGPVKISCCNLTLAPFWLVGFIWLDALGSHLFQYPLDTEGGRSNSCFPFQKIGQISFCLRLSRPAFVHRWWVHWIIWSSYWRIWFCQRIAGVTNIWSEMCPSEVHLPNYSTVCCLWTSTLCLWFSYIFFIAFCICFLGQLACVSSSLMFLVASISIRLICRETKLSR